MRAFFVSLLVMFFLLITGCASTFYGIKVLQEPESDKTMIIGNVIIENINQEFGFDNWGLSAQVVIVGKNKDGTIMHHKVYTDNKGYYCIPNLQQGQYVLKAIILPIIGGRHVKIVNDRNSSMSEFYRMRHPEREIEYTASWFPMAADKKIRNYHIIWMGLRRAHIEGISEKSIGEVLVAQSKEGLKEKRFYENGYPYTRLDPLTYFKNKFPDSGWWKL
jgi:hypothetical protein